MLAIARRQPARALLAISAVGWIALVMLHVREPAPVQTHLHHSVGPVAAAPFEAVASFAMSWLPMLLAMAPLLLIREIRGVWEGSLRRLRRWTVASFVAGYLGVWLVAGVCLTMLSDRAVGVPSRVAALVLLVALWHVAPMRQRCLNACHRAANMRAFGVAALWDPLRYGVATGAWCAGACGPIMLLVLLMPQHHLTGMIAATVFAVRERYNAPRRPQWRVPVLHGRFAQWPEPMTASTRQ